MADQPRAGMSAAEIIESLLDPLGKPCRFNQNTNRCLEHLFWDWPCPHDRARAWLEEHR